MSWRTSSSPNRFLKNRKLLQAAIIKPQIEWEVEPLICLGYCVFACYNEIKARSRAPADVSSVPHLCTLDDLQTKAVFPC